MPIRYTHRHRHTLSHTHIHSACSGHCDTVLTLPDRLPTLIQKQFAQVPSDIQTDHQGAVTLTGQFPSFSVSKVVVPKVP